MQKEWGFTGFSLCQQHNRVLPCTVHLEVLWGSISPSTATVAAPRGRQVGTPCAATVVLAVDTAGGGGSIQCVFKESDTGRVTTYIRVK